MKPTPEILENLQWMTPPAEIDGSVRLLVMLLAIILVALVVALFFWRRSQRVATEVVRRPPPHEIARAALDRLKGRLGDDNDREFVIQISLILRVYIQDRFGLRAPHRSTEEFLHEASQSALLSADKQAQLARFLDQCDLVKFGKRGAALELQTMLWQTASRFVDETAESVPLPTEGEAGPSSTKGRAFATPKWLRPRRRVRGNVSHQGAHV